MGELRFLHYRKHTFGDMKIYVELASLIECLNNDIKLLHEEGDPDGAAILESIKLMLLESHSLAK